jgi:hypothetical protein
MSPPLRPCPSCQRHLRTSELSCPFCAAPVPSTVRAARPQVPATQRMSRAALVAFTLLGTPACEDDVGANPEAGLPPEVREAGVDTPVYGAPPDTREAGLEVSADSADGLPSDAREAGVDTPVYGAPPPDGGVDMPVYGAPPPDGGQG